MTIVVNELLGYEHLKIFQDTEKFNFSLDSTLLAAFVTINKKVNKIVDLGCGNAPIPLFLSLRTSVPIIGVELQKEVYDLAIKSVEINGLSNQISIINNDMKHIYKDIGNNEFDLVTCNPPYFKYTEESNINKNDYLTIARHEVFVTLDQVLFEANRLLKSGGYFAMVHRPDRIADIMVALRKHRLEPKRIRYVYPKPGKQATAILIEAKKDGNLGGLKTLEPLYVFDNQKEEYSEEVKKIFNYRP